MMSDVEADVMFKPRSADRELLTCLTGSVSHKLAQKVRLRGYAPVLARSLQEGEHLVTDTEEFRHVCVSLSIDVLLRLCCDLCQH